VTAELPAELPAWPPAAVARLDGFTGRKTALSRAGGWLATADSGILVIAGPAGAGKSALLARLAELSARQPDVEAAGPPHVAPGRLAADEPAHFAVPEGLVLPPAGSITASVDARNQTFAEVQSAIADAVGVTIAPGAVALLARATGALSPTIVVDSVDEAASGDVVAIGLLLADLASVGFRVLVGLGTGGQPDPAGEAPVKVRRRCDVLTTAFPGATVIRLDSPALAGENYRDVAGLVTGCLLAHGSADAGHAFEAGSRVGYAARGNFLAARLAVASMLGSSPDGRPAAEATCLAGQLGAAVELGLRRLPGPVRDRVRPMLIGLAWAQGAGADEAAWPILASAVTGSRFGRADVALTVDRAPQYVSGGRQAGYRLAHEELARYFRLVACREH
jgi:hypothetical protein